MPWHCGRIMSWSLIETMQQPQIIAFNILRWLGHFACNYAKEIRENIFECNPQVLYKNVVSSWSVKTRSSIITTSLEVA